jgi:nicotinamidase-related amidase
VKKIIISIVSILVLSILIIIANYIIVDKNQSQISQGKPIVQKDTIRKAILVIDIQEGITGKLATDDYYILKSDELISNINSVIDSSARNHIIVVYVKSEISNFLINILNSSLEKGSFGSQFDSRLKLVSNLIISKDKGDAFSNPLLDSILIKNGINNLVFVGIDLAECVNSTILAAVNRKYRISIISDAVLTKSDSLKIVTIDKFRQGGFEIITSNDYYKSLHR